MFDKKLPQGVTHFFSACMRCTQHDFERYIVLTLDVHSQFLCLFSLWIYFFRQLQANIGVKGSEFIYVRALSSLQLG